MEKRKSMHTKHTHHGMGPRGWRGAERNDGPRPDHPRFGGHFREAIRAMRGGHPGMGPREHGHGRGPRDGRGGPSRRMFEAGELRLVLLRLLEDQPRHGYDLIREIESRTGGAYAPSPGVVYPTLTLLEEQELIEAAASAGSKRAYSLAEAGKTHLNEHRVEAENALRRLDALGAQSGRTESGPIWRAMANLRAALGQRLATETGKQALFDAADIIDDAARKIERLP